ncbi:unnamed protein product [Ilex paraguariensis]|uniref:Glycosyltransferase n=1 Tax=Ilex paraguariensis TaxID=185542 RepID=A0ABC8RC68_9AQUA
MDSQETSFSLLMLPWLAHGHISPFLELAKQLAKRNFHVYLCSTPINLSSIEERIVELENQSLSIEIVELHLPSSPELPPHYHTTNGLPIHLQPTLRKAFEMASPSLSNILKTLNPHLFINDVVYQWPSAVASSHNIPVIQFQSSSAAMVSYFSHLLRTPDVEYPFPAVYLRDFELAKMLHILEASTSNGQGSDSEREDCSHFVLIKSSNEIEGKYIDYISSMIKRKVMPVGPIIKDPVRKDENLEVIEWLEKKHHCSSVFVSFGSECFLSKEEMEEIANGLELSNVNFIWVVRFPLGDETMVEDALPKGFLERVGDTGIVIKGWAPQEKILRHSSIGGFVSHCGWNSVLESMEFGVPIIAMPMQFDQPLNARLMVELGVGMEVWRDDSGKLHREEIAKVIREVIVDKRGEAMRRKAKELGEKIRLKGDEEMNGAVEAISQLCQKTKRRSNGHTIISPRLV